jgi:IclR family transcriptional regulator, pca regulon regulatory protein
MRFATSSQSRVDPTWHPTQEEVAATLCEVRAREWAVTDQHLAPAIRSIAAPIHNGNGEIDLAVYWRADSQNLSMATAIPQQPNMTVARIT